MSFTYIPRSTAHWYQVRACLPPLRIRLDSSTRCEAALRSVKTASFPLRSTHHDSKWLSLRGERSPTTFEPEPPSTQIYSHFLVLVTSNLAARVAFLQDFHGCFRLRSRRRPSGRRFRSSGILLVAFIPVHRRIV